MRRPIAHNLHIGLVKLFQLVISHKKIKFVLPFVEQNITLLEFELQLVELVSYLFICVAIFNAQGTQIPQVALQLLFLG